MFILVLWRCASFDAPIKKFTRQYFFKLVIFAYVFYLLTARQIILLRGVAVLEDR